MAWTEIYPENDHGRLKYTHNLDQDLSKGRQAQVVGGRDEPGRQAKKNHFSAMYDRHKYTSPGPGRILRMTGSRTHGLEP